MSSQATGKVRHSRKPRWERPSARRKAQLGSDTDLITQVRSGGIEFLNIAGSVISTVAPGAAVTNVGFTFAGYDQAWKAVDGPVGDYVKGQMEKAGLMIAAKASDNSFRQITSASKSIRTPADLKGYRIRVPVSPIFTSLFSSLGPARRRSTSTSSTPRCSVFGCPRTTR